MKIKINIKSVFKTIYTFLVLFLIFIGSGLVISYLQLPGGLKSFFVLSGSMRPKIPTGSLIFVKSQPDNNYSIGDIVTFKSLAEKDNPKPQYTTTHRIINIENREKEGKVYITKGDANDANDWQGVLPDLVLGKIVFHIPFIGSLIATARTKEGVIFLIIIPATILIFSEFLTIKTEMNKIITDRRHSPNEKSSS